MRQAPKFSVAQQEQVVYKNMYGSLWVGKVRQAWEDYKSGEYVYRVSMDGYWFLARESLLGSSRDIPGYLASLRRK